MSVLDKLSQTNYYWVIMNLKSFIEEINTQSLNVEGIIVYQQGREEVSHRWIPELRRNIFSASKSFTSIAVGMAIDEGKLKLSDTVTRFFNREPGSSDLQSQRWDSLKLEHLLTMTMGHADSSRPETVKESLSYELTSDPGTTFTYDNTCPYLVSAMITKATGITMKDYLVKKLFTPLGIFDVQWRETEDGYTIGGTELVLSTSEMALFGRFLLQRGNWEGKQLVSSSWIETASRTQVPSQFNNRASYALGYGYYFWTSLHGAYRCDGRGGQYIIVFPALDAVVTINSEEQNTENILQAVWDHILPQL